MGGVYRRIVAVAGAVVAAIAVCALSASASAAQVARPLGGVHRARESGSAEGGTWGVAAPLPVGGGVFYPKSLSCVSPGNCGAIGISADSGVSKIVVVQETDGTWGGRRALSGLTPADSIISEAEMSCGAAGNCVAAGYFTIDDSQTQGFIATEAGGTWGSLEAVPGIGDLGDASANSWPVAVSCSAAGDCLVVGNYDDGGDTISPFAVQETDGSWGDAEQIPGTADPAIGTRVLVASVSCSSPGNCAAVGSGSLQGFIASETDGAWGAAAQVVPGMLDTVSCTSDGNCSAGGSSEEVVNGKSAFQAIVVDESGGGWGTAEEVPGIAALNTGLFAETTAVSCASPGNCAAAGTYQVSLGSDGYAVDSFVANQASGVWGTAAQMAGLAVNAISCGAAGNCTAGGASTGPGGSQQAALASEADGVWGAPAEVPGTTALNTDGNAAVQAISCTGAGYCTAIGYYQGTPPMYAFADNEATASDTSLSLTAPAATYGAENSVRAAVTVTSGSGALPTGTVTISAGSTGLCVTALASGTGSCTFRASALPAGTHELTAAYGGNSDFLASVSQAAAFRVSRASSRIRFTLSKSTISYGREQTERLSVVVTGHYAGVPAGTVDVMVGRTSVCAIALRAGRGSCTLGRKQLRVGTLRLVARYLGDADFLGCEAEKTVVVRK